MSTVIDAVISPAKQLSPREMLIRNVSVLGERHRDLAEQLTIANPPVDIQFHDTPDGVPCATLGGKQLCSRHRPIEEASRLVDSIDLVEHAVVVVFGFGLGYHVQRLAERMKRAGVIIVVEPDVRLIKAAFERIDMTAWMSRANIVWFTNADDRAAVAQKLDGSEAIVAQGVEFIEHPASRARLGDVPARFSEMFRQYISTSKTTLMTTLMRSLDTVRNMVHNIDHYATAGGVADLKDACKDKLAVVVSAGPSLHRSIKWLQTPGLRERCCIIAVQTTLKPLLEAGIKPHFVTALDYHEISRRFYEQLDPEQVRDVTLVVEPKAHPVILDSYPGPVRCCAADFLDRLLGPTKREMGALKLGATVAHLALYLAEHLGCNPIALVGQDLGFTDGLYYAPGIAIEDTWAPELNPFNTIEMMQWQRIARHRGHLQKVEDVNGRSIYTDAQMLAYLRQFERDFSAMREKGIRVIDATEGGVAKQHTSSLALKDVIQRHAKEPCPAPPLPKQLDDAARLAEVRKRIERVRQEVVALEHVSNRAKPLLDRMLNDQDDARKMERHFKQLEKHRLEVEKRMETFELLNAVNQLGVFKRMKADRRMHMSAELSPVERQRAELERDRENVRWISDAAGELQEQLYDAQRLLNGEKVSFRPRPTADLPNESDSGDEQPVDRKSEKSKVAAIVPIDPSVNATMDALSADWGGINILQTTLTRLSQSRRIESIILLVPEGVAVESLIDRSAIDLPVEIERCGERVFPQEQEAIAAARAISATSWRGGITGVTIYDELIAPHVMSDVMQRRGLTAALIVGPDWPMVNVTGPGGCDTLIERHLDYPKQNSIVFSQSPPGLCGCVVSAKEMQSLAERNRVATIGARLTYQPSAPQPDPIAKDLCVQVERDVRASLMRMTAGTKRDGEQLRRAIADVRDPVHELNDPIDIVHRVEKAQRQVVPDFPQHLIIELTTKRTSSGVFAKHPFGKIDRPNMSIDALQRVLSSIERDTKYVVTFDGVGDLLLHDQFDECITIAKQCGASAVHVRTELLCDQSIVDRLMATGVDVVSVDLHADRAATYQTMMGCDRFKDVLQLIDYALNKRRRLTPQHGLSAIALPWFVPRLQRCVETIEDIDTFFDRWQHAIGTCVIEGKPRYERDVAEENEIDDLLPCYTPRKVVERELRQRMTIFSDGSVPISEVDLAGRDVVGNVLTSSVQNIWRDLYQARTTNMDSLQLYRP